MEKVQSNFINTAPMNANDLKIILEEVRSGGRNWDDEDKVFLVKSMVEHIGSTDSRLRDQLIYTSFYQLIIEKNLIEHDLLKEVLDFCLNERLFKGIGETGTDTVFTRSFTTLLIALVLYRDNEDNFLTQEMITTIKDQLVEYISLEKDLRGFISGKGWAHSIAHVADAFDELIKNNHIDKELYKEILMPLWKKIFVSDSVYVHDEDERLLIPILEMLNNGLELGVIGNLLQRIPDELLILKKELDEENYWFLVANCKVFLKSFYIEVKKNTSLLPLQTTIENCLTEI
ncbi:DUF2785 domain-containing protein [Bacillus sp. Cr_A10]|uniref:DUF2785 domain-containing protein n=1 Tax=Bacillus sp. Cr_A10 TaxID=3033993 RepID=UPI0023DC8D9F|nr:DUF2785 domain-containing protein [Bacillus sp. Cr_A10]MDF2066496.1 DUF2785 domain-containing protein [Bacillus sp. Cr_A10]